MGKTLRHKTQTRKQTNKQTNEKKPTDHDEINENRLMLTWFEFKITSMTRYLTGKYVPDPIDAFRAWINRFSDLSKQNTLFILSFDWLIVNVII